jgi:hypothetical protein
LGWSTHPTRGYNAWRTATLGLATNLLSISCPSVHLCVAVDDRGDAWTSTTPAGGARAWKRAHIDSAPLIGVSCPSRRLCVAADNNGAVLASTNPTRGRRTWRIMHVDSNVYETSVVSQEATFTDIACPSTRLCVAVDTSGRAVFGRG